MGGSQGGGPRSGSAEQSLSRIRYIRHREVQILHCNFSGIGSTEELRAVVEEAGLLIRSHPPRSALLLINLDGVPYTLQNVAVLRRALEENRAYVRARAVCGLPAIAQLSFAAMARLSQRPMQQFRDSNSALDWLVEVAR